jgi:adenosylcobinamide-phosphate synthase
MARPSYRVITIGCRFGAVGAGLLIDRLLGEPPTPVHPVAWFGRAMHQVEQRVWADRRAPGVAYAAVGAALGWAAGKAVHSTTIGVAISVAGNALRSTAHDIGGVNEAGDIDRARAELRALVGRDPSELDASGIAAAVIESVGENSVDAVIAPVFWAMVAGAPGTLAYRAINTMDAMVGHRSDRYRHFGTAAARLDDLVNYVPARLFVLLVVAARPGRGADIRRIVRRDAPGHPSPNAGVAESSVAAALGIELGGPLRYCDRVEERPTLGDGPRPTATDVGAAIELANRIEWVVVAALFGAVVAAGSSPIVRFMRPAQ